MPDERQGRYNIVGKARAHDTGGAPGLFFVKRYLAPESACIEDLAYRVLAILGNQRSPHALLPAAETLLVAGEAPGEPWRAGDAGDPEAVRAVGAHCAAAYLIGNADMRPRNVLAHRCAAGTRVTVYDLEHCFFDRALALPDAVDRFDPRGIDSLRRSIGDLTRHRVLSPASTQRAPRAFLPNEDRHSAQGRAFREGWHDTYAAAKASADPLLGLIAQRIHDGSPLIIGTQGYRRAMVMIDVDDIAARIRAYPSSAFDMHY